MSAEPVHYATNQDVQRAQDEQRFLVALQRGKPLPVPPPPLPAQPDPLAEARAEVEEICETFGVTADGEPVA